MFVPQSDKHIFQHKYTGHLIIHSISSDLKHGLLSIHEALRLYS